MQFVHTFWIQEDSLKTQSETSLRSRLLFVAVMVGFIGAFCFMILVIGPILNPRPKAVEGVAYTGKPLTTCVMDEGGILCQLPEGQDGKPVLIYKGEKLKFCKTETYTPSGGAGPAVASGPTVDLVRCPLGES